MAQAFPQCPNCAEVSAAINLEIDLASGDVVPG